MFDVVVYNLENVNVFEPDSYLSKKFQGELFGKICLATCIHVMTQIAPSFVFGYDVDIFGILKLVKD